MRKIFFVLTFLFLTTRCWAQCNIQYNNRPDGKQIKYNRPQLFAKNNNIELGITLQFDGSNYYLGIINRFLNITAEKNIGNLHIIYSNKTTSVLKIIHSELTYNKGSNVGMALYKLEPNDIKLFKKINIISISFKTETGSTHNFKTKYDNSIVRDQLTCLN